MLIRSVCCVAVLLLTVGGALVPAEAGKKEHPIVTVARSHLKDVTKPFTLVVIVHVKEGSAGKFESAFAKALTETRKEKGNIRYDLNRDSRDAGRYVVYERWQSLAALDRHLKTDHIQALGAVLTSVLAREPEVKILLPVAE